MSGDYDLMRKTDGIDAYPFLARLVKGCTPPDGWERVTTLKGQSVYQRDGRLCSEYQGLFIYPWNKKVHRFVIKRCEEYRRNNPQQMCRGSYT